MQEDSKKIPYFRILKEAFSLTWKNRYLWWFGFLVLLSNLGGLDYLRSDNKNSSESLAVVKSLPLSPWLIGGIVILAIFLIVILILGIISRGALIASLEKERRGIRCDFKQSFKDGKKTFWKIFLISFFSNIFLLVAGLILFPPVVFLFVNHNYLISFFMGAIAAIIFIPLLVMVAYLKIFGYLFTILGKLKTWSSLENAYNLFRKNIKPSILMALFFLPIGIAILIMLSLLIIPIGIILLPIGLIVFLLAGKIGAVLIAGFGLLILMLILFILRSVFEVFAQAIWILFFREIAVSEEKEVVMEVVIEKVPLSTETMPITEYKQNQN